MPKKTFECAEKAGAILITQAKDNQKSLSQQIEHGCNIEKPIESHADDPEKYHGRIEKRTYERFSAMPMLSKWKEEWEYIVQIVRVIRFREVIGSNNSSSEISYYVMNRAIPIKDASKAIREHWGIENRLHYVKDTAFQEDSANRRVNPCIFSTCIDFALNRLRINECDNIKGQLYKNTLSFDIAMKYLLC